MLKKSEMRLPQTNDDGSIKLDSSGNIVWRTVAVVVSYHFEPYELVKKNKHFFGQHEKIYFESRMYRWLRHKEKMGGKEYDIFMFRQKPIVDQGWKQLATEEVYKMSKSRRYQDLLENGFVSYPIPNDNCAFVVATIQDFGNTSDFRLLGSGENERKRLLSMDWMGRNTNQPIFNPEGGFKFPRRDKVKVMDFLQKNCRCKLFMSKLRAFVEDNEWIFIGQWYKKYEPYNFY